MIDASEIKVYERLRRYGTKGKTRSSGHAKSVTKLSFELGEGESIWSQKPKAEGSETTGVESTTTIVAEYEDVPALQAVMFLEKFENSNDGKAFGRKAAAYKAKKDSILAEYGATSVTDLTESARVRLKKELAKASFYYYEYQVVVTYGDEDRKIHSTRMKLIQRRPEHSWTLPKLKDDGESSSNQDD